MTENMTRPVAGDVDPAAYENRRQVLYWRLLSRIFAADEQAALESASLAIVDDLGLPAALLDPTVSVDNIVQRFPSLGEELPGLLAGGEAAGDGPAPAAAGNETGPDEIEPDAAGPGAGTRPDAAVGRAEARNAALVSKLLLNVFATGSGGVSATQLAGWQSDAAWLKAALGPGAGDAGGLSGTLADLEADLVRRMHLREVLANNALASKLTPSMSLIEQLLRDKHNLSGVALANAKALIRRFVDEVAEVLRTQVEKASAGTIDRSVPPKRVFRNLDLDRTIWKNLPNWNDKDQRLYVDRLYYRQTARRTSPARMIVVVDQSGSMTDSMVNCTILASIFAGLPKVDVHLIAYDTKALDLTPWVHDPFEVLLRTKLGGGNDGPVAMAMARPKITDPRNTVMVWISDFYEFDRSQPLFDGIEAVHRSGVKFIPVGSVNSSGHQSVNPWFRQRFKDLGTPVISGHIRKLVLELKNFVA
ncbi:VWA domain-containing protein [Frankia sp. CNm7]|uniref:VWA domain-containing protein n=1 Tax=Frankia nepalensis TaxID=1836974 RepID=A0A937RPN8_9ACTN|nr:VWA domain-containing protein [Frankia nepalensis]MBL7496207.1 VWA domain-containing protein [Frankia nepalensis]MBL7511654.1 VWA domain-containing protein [Frankia nepalensis]MBL7524673.1 VWA domain-containing protein [Frankia nepalensis]MBL7631104.1 VWA domain-containing protein [Frankia nepalensis]